MARSGAALVKVNACLVMMICSATIAAPHAEAAITCAKVLSRMSPCIGYLQKGGSMPPSCCDGLKSLYSAADTTPELQEACRCVKSLVPSTGANPSFVNALPGICHVNIPYKYSPSLDCSKITRRDDEFFCL